MRRDDMESVASMLVYFLVGLLPWMGLKAANADRKLEQIYILPGR
jgi:hypothetical protein